MTTNYIEDDDEGSNESERKVTLTRAQIKGLEAKAKKVDELQAEIDKLTKQSVFNQAGIDPEDPKMKYFVKGYDGELKVDAIKAAATEAGFISAPEPDPEQQANLEALARVATASAGGTSLASNSETAIKAEMETALATGGKEAVMAVARKYGATFVDDYS